MTTHPQSRMREARESAENPAKTTLWSAPMRAQASIVMGRSHTCCAIWLFKRQLTVKWLSELRHSSHERRVVSG